MRGIVSLAAALALPLTTASGAAFPFRADMVVITFVVIVSTLVLQGLSLAPLIRMLRLKDDNALEQEEAVARKHAATAALGKLDHLETQAWPFPDHLDRLRTHYGRRAQRFANPEATDPDCSPQGADAFRRLRHETLTAERLAVIDLRNQGIITDEVLHKIEQELDIEAVRIGVGEIRPTRAESKGTMAAPSSSHYS